MSLTEWLDAEYEEQLMRSPMNLTYLGRSERKDELDEFTLESYQGRPRVAGSIGSRDGKSL